MRSHRRTQVHGGGFFSTTNVLGVAFTVKSENSRVGLAQRGQGAPVVRLLHSVPSIGKCQARRFNGLKMSRHEIEAEFLGHLAATMKLMFSPEFWRLAALSVVPTLLWFFVGSGYLFVVYFCALCLWARSCRLGGLIGWFVATQTIYLYYSFPESGHFIEWLLRAPARVSSAVPTSEQVLATVPTDMSSRVFWSLVFGLRGGGLVGLGLGMLGRKLWGSRFSE